MELTYGQLEDIRRSLAGVGRTCALSDDQLLQRVGQFCTACSAGARLVRYLTQLSSILRRSGEGEVALVARSALAWVVEGHSDALPPKLAALRAVVDTHVAGDAVAQIRRLTGERDSLLPGTLSDAERKQCETLFLELVGGEVPSDDRIRYGIAQFVNTWQGLADARWVSRMLQNVAVLAGVLSTGDAEQQDVARAALSYLLLREDVLHDDLGLVGRLDDAFVLDVALDLLDLKIERWACLLDDLCGSWPFVNEIALQDDGELTRPTEHSLIHAAVMRKLLRSEDTARHAVCVVPAIGPLSFELGLIAALGAVAEDPACASGGYRPSLGDTVRVGGAGTARFDGWFSHNGQPMLKLTVFRRHRGQWDRSSRFWPARMRFLLSPAPAERYPPGPLPAGGPTSASVSPLERLLHLAAPVAFEAEVPPVLVVARVARARRLASTCQMFGAPLTQVIPMGEVAPDGDTLIWGKAPGPAPVLVVAPDADMALMRLRAQAARLIILDLEGSPRDEYQSTAGLFDQENASVLALCPENAANAVRSALEAGIELVELDTEQLAELTRLRPGAPEARSRFLRHQARLRRSVGSEIAVCHVYSTAADRISVSVSQLKELAKATENAVLEALQDEAMQAFMSLLRQIIPSHELDAPDKHIERLAELLASRGAFLDGSARAIVEDALSSLRDFRDEVGSGARLDALRRCVEATGARTVICARGTPTAAVRKALRPQRVRVRTSVEAEPALAGSTVVVGWLGWRLMSKLIWPPAADQIALLLYGVERTWYERAVERRNRARAWRRRNAKTSELVAPPVASPIDRDQMAAEGDAGRDPPDPIDEREAAAWRLRAEERMGGGTGTKLDVGFVGFSDGAFAFMKPDRHLCVATEVVEPNGTEAGAEPELVHLRALDLVVGDILVLSVTNDSDVIRSAADRVLDAGVRELAQLWRTALRRFADSESFVDLNDLAQRLASAGCVRTTQTLAAWLSEDHYIGPQGYRQRTLHAIANVTGDQELMNGISACQQAISIVRNAHREAADGLRRQISKRVAWWLSEGGELDDLIEIEKGVVLARVAHLDWTPRRVAGSRTNRLIVGDEHV